MTEELGKTAERRGKALVSSAGSLDAHATGADPLDESQSIPPAPESALPPDAAAAAEAAAEAAAAEAARGSGAAGDPPGLRQQFASTKDSARALLDAHVELGKAEMGEIGDRIKKIAAFVGIAVAAAIAASLLVGVGLPLFLGEWIFGSMGWGLLHGLLFLSAIVVAMALLTVDMPAPSVGGSFFAGVITAVVVGILLGLDVTNRLWGLAGDQLLPKAAPDVRPLAAAMVVAPLVLGVLFGLGGLVRGLGDSAGWSAPSLGGAAAAAMPAGIYGGWLAAFGYAYSSDIAWFDWPLLAVGVLVAAAIVGTLAVASRARAGNGLLAGLSGGAAAGIGLALLTAIAFGPRVGAAVGITVGLIAWIGAMGVAVARREGFDFGAYGESFKPQKTIDMTKETIEWARARMPLSRGS